MGDWSREIGTEPRVDHPVHPGEMLREEWLEPLGMNANQLAKSLGVNRQTVYEIVGERRGLSAEMALRLSRWSGTSDRFWMNLQSRYEYEVAKMEHGEEIEREVEPREMATG